MTPPMTQPANSLSRDLAHLDALRNRALAAARTEPTSLTPEEFTDAMQAIGAYLDALKAGQPWICGTTLDPAR